MNSEENYKDDYQVVSVLLEMRNGLVYLPNQEEPFTGRNIGTDNNGRMKFDTNYKDGKPHGKQSSWFKNGLKSSEENYKDGKAHGKRTWWHKNGQKWLEENYKDGQQVD